MNILPRSQGLKAMAAPGHLGGHTGTQRQMRAAGPRESGLERSDGGDY